MATCFLLGGTTLLIRCGELLRDRGHQIVGIGTDDEIVAAWAERHGLTLHPASADLASILSADPPDYLFSIVNDRLLRPDALAIPRAGAVNYHDGPLPRYAGMHATSWAILNGERTHGITWHAMAADVDAGAILTQRAVDIAEDETALSLNAKCYEAAADAFAELVARLESGTLEPRPQALADRSYYGRHRRPPAAAVIAWDRPAGEISALARALEFGPYRNPLGTPKIWLGDDVLVPLELEVGPMVQDAVPGTIIETSTESVVVATRDRAVEVRRFLTSSGERLSAGDVTRRFGLQTGDRLPELDQRTAARLDALQPTAARGEEYWVRRLQALEAPQVPYLRAPAAAGAGAPDWARLDVMLPPEFIAMLKVRHAARFLADGVVTAFAAYLARICGQPTFDLDLSTPSLVEDVAGIESLVAGELPVRVSLPPGAKFGDAYASIATALAHARRVGPYLRDVWLRHPELRTAAASGTIDLPVTVAMVADVGGYRPRASTRICLVVQRDVSWCQLVYDRRALDDAAAGRIASHLATLLREIAQSPSRPLAQLPLLTEEERHRVLVEWNRTEADYPRNETVHGMIRAAAARSPDAVALEFADRRLTYRELLARADALSGRLRTLGVGPDVLVALLAERSPELVVGMLATLCAGGAYLPIDPTYPAERIEFMLRDSASQVLLTQRSLRDGLPAHAAVEVLLDDWLEELPVYDAATPPDRIARTDAGPRNLAYVIYTSGSTGRPKGVLVEHRGVVNYLAWGIAAYGLADGGAGSPVHSSVAFDLTVTSLLAPLAAGRCVVLAPESLGAEALAATMRAHEDFSLVKLTPSHLDLLRHQIPADEAAGRTRCFVVGGEALQGQSLAFWTEHAPSTRIVNEYGPTETVVGCCVHEATPEDAASASVPIGRPIANTRLYVLDGAMQPVPAGVPGELFIGGDGVARGYLNRPELTSERFVPDPFADGAAVDVRLYRTGDRVRYDEAGRLVFLGRLDDQVKVRGYRVELGEVEASVAAHPAVAEAAALVHEVRAGDVRLVAYFVPQRREGASVIEETDLREFVEARLPTYMVPSAFVRLDALPLTPNGKVDRARLAAPARAPTSASSERAATALERTLIGIWAEVLGLSEESVGVTSDFFELGGHSLLAVQMILRVEEVLGRRLPLATLLTRATLERFAAALEAGGESADALVVRIRDGAPDVPGLFFFHGAITGGGLYCHSLARELDADQPVYLVHPFQPGGPETVEEMAAAVVPAIRAAQPEGPYHLGGHCNGAFVAFEVARLLRGSGERVGLVALVNATDRNAGMHSLRRAFGGAARLAHLPRSRELDLYLSLREQAARLRRLVPRAAPGSSLRDRLTLVAGAARSITRKGVAVLRRAVTPVTAAAVAAGAMATNPDPEMALDARRWTYLSRATKGYAPRYYDGEVTVLFWERSGALDDEDGLHAGDATRGWSRVSRRTQVRTIPGKNRELSTRSPSALGRELRALLQAYRPSADTSVARRRPEDPASPRPLRPTGAVEPR